MADKTPASGDGAVENNADGEQLNALTAQIENERLARIAAEKATLETNKRLQTATDQQLNSKEEAVENAISRVEGEASQGETEYAAAMERGDHVAAAKAQRKMAQAESKLTLLGAEKNQVSQWKSEWAAKRDTLVQQPRTEDPLAGFTPQSRAWIGQRSAKWADPSYRDKVTKAHYKALGDDIKPDTPEYFKFVETQIGERNNPVETHQTREDPVIDGFETGEDDEPSIELETEHVAQPTRQEPQRRSTSSAAPPSRSVPSQAGGRKSQTVKLTAREMDAARYSFPEEFRESPQKAYTSYAKNKLAIMAEKPDVYN